MDKWMKMIESYIDKVSSWSLFNRSEIIWFSLGVISILILQLIF